MSGERGKPIHLTNGERRLVIEACELAINEWSRQKEVAADKQYENYCHLRKKQYQRIIKECREADPLGSDQ